MVPAELAIHAGPNKNDSVLERDKNIDIFEMAGIPSNFHEMIIALNYGDNVKETFQGLLLPTIFE